jgi:hypothetical protein
MLLNWWQQIIDNIYEGLMMKAEIYVPKIIWAITILLFGILIAIIIYESVIFIFRKFKIINLINKLESKMDLNLWEDVILESNIGKKGATKIIKRKKLTEKINVDIIVAKAFSYYIFLIFFRLSIVVIWITEVEIFLSDVLNYLPNLFIAVCIWFFWIRFADTIYDIVFYALELTKHQTSRIIAMGSKFIVLFFTIMIVLNYVKIVDEFIINTIFVGFIATITVWAWIAFWLGWKDVAREILESFKK